MSRDEMEECPISPEYPPLQKLQVVNDTENLLPHRSYQDCVTTTSYRKQIFPMNKWHGPSAAAYSQMSTPFSSSGLSGEMMATSVLQPTSVDRAAGKSMSVGPSISPMISQQPQFMNASSGILQTFRVGGVNVPLRNMPPVAIQAVSFQQVGADDSQRRNDSLVRPRYTYAFLITMAIHNSQNKMLTVSEIYNYIMDKFPFYRKNQKRWKNCIRHNLSIHQCFVKLSLTTNNPAKGCFWTLHPESENMLENGRFIRRKNRFKTQNNESIGQSRLQNSDANGELPSNIQRNHEELDNTINAVKPTCMNQPHQQHLQNNSPPPITAQPYHNAMNPHGRITNLSGSDSGVYLNSLCSSATSFSMSPQYTDEANCVGSGYGVYPNSLCRSATSSSMSPQYTDEANCVGSGRGAYPNSLCSSATTYSMSPQYTDEANCVGSSRGAYPNSLCSSATSSSMSPQYTDEANCVGSGRGVYPNSLCSSATSSSMSPQYTDEANCVGSGRGVYPNSLCSSATSSSMFPHYIAEANYICCHQCGQIKDFHVNATD